ncbi:hypothetical protein GEV39_05285 [Pseudomonas sp. NY5710]|nr:hypothetical protein GEV39_05285 [Pseudomonas sp. NY5710]
MGAGEPAKQAPQWLARAAPVFAGLPAPTGIEQDSALETTWLPPNASVCFKAETRARTPQPPRAHAPLPHHLPAAPHSRAIAGNPAPP